MKAAQPGVKRRAGLMRQPQHLVPPRRQVHRSRFEVPIPQGVARALRRQRIPLLARSERRLCVHVLRHVLDDCAQRGVRPIGDSLNGHAEGASGPIGRLILALMGGGMPGLIHVWQEIDDGQPTSVSVAGSSLNTRQNVSLASITSLVSGSSRQIPSPDRARTARCFCWLASSSTELEQ